MAEAPVTLITGTRKGIGEALARHYVARGHVVVGCSRGQPQWQLDGYHHLTADVSDERAVLRLFGELRRSHKRLDNLINNAGIASMNHALLTPMSTVRKVLATNVEGTFLFCREAAKLMMQRKQGRIVNLASVATPLKLAGEAIYAASKAAVVSLTEILARELSRYGVTVNAVGAAPVDTDMIRSVPAEKMRALEAQLAIPRFATIDDITNVVDFLLQPASDFITGQTIYLGGA